MEKTTTIDVTPVFVTLSRTAIFTLETYSNDDPDGQDLMYGLTAMAEALNTYCPDTPELNAYYDGIRCVRAGLDPVVFPVTTEEMQYAHDMLRDLIQKLDPKTVEMDKVEAALEYLKDFWETYNEDN